MLEDYGLFLRKFLVSPSKIGSVTPSSKFLTKKMLGKIPWSSLESIVELGAGTGVFTEYIAQHKNKNCKAIIFEQDTMMRNHLEKQFPELFFAAQAENLNYILKKFDLSQVDCIISGLPFALLSNELCRRIIHEADIALKENGEFIAFQYSLQMYPMFRHQFSKVDLGFELRNFPPAFIYYCQ